MSNTGRLTLQAQVESGPAQYQFRTVDGLRSPEAFRDEELLLLETLWEQDLGRLLVVQANYGVVGTVLAATAESVQMTETSARSARLCRENVALNDVTADVSLLASPANIAEEFDAACYAPAGYTPIEVGKQRLVDTLSMLEPGGSLYVAGSKQTGLSRYERCLDEHCQTVETVHTSGSQRGLEATTPAGFTPPEYVTPRTIEPTVDGVELTLVSLPGLFSADSLDHGTRLLLETAPLGEDESVLDLACGYGPIGTYVAASTAADVLLADDDARATACAERSLDATGVDGRVETADGTRGIDRTFDRVLCNPPTHAGSGVLSDLFAGVADVLVDGGELSLVHHETLDLDEYLHQVGSIVDRHSGEEHTIVTVRA